MCFAASRSGSCCRRAHAVDREYRLLAALHPLDFPGAASRWPCATIQSVIGAIFYVMELAKGRSYANGALPDFDPATRRRMYEQLVDTLADLHNIDPAAAGLRRLRQARQLFRAPGDALDAPVPRLADGLYSRDGAADRLPARDDSRAVAHLDRPRRLSHRQCRVRRRRHADGGARLGAGDARRSAGGFLLSRDAVDDAGGRGRRAGRAGPARRSASRRSTKSSRAIPSVRACRSRTSSTGISPTISSASPASSRASRSA